MIGSRIPIALNELKDATNIVLGAVMSVYLGVRLTAIDTPLNEGRLIVLFVDLVLIVYNLTAAAGRMENERPGRAILHLVAAIGFTLSLSGETHRLKIYDPILEAALITWFVLIGAEVVLRGAWMMWRRRQKRRRALLESEMML